MKPDIHLNDGVSPDEIYDCWNHIGVWRKDNEKCERLDEVIHCNNCPIFANSGRSLLHRTIPDGYTEEWTEIISQKLTIGKNKLLSAILFRVEKEWYLAPISIIHDITPVKKVLTIPHNKNPAIQGITNIRGELITCLSLASILSIEHADNPYTKHTTVQRLLVISNNHFRVSFLIDEIKGIYKYKSSDVQFTHDTSKNSSTNILKGIIAIDKHHAGLIDGDILTDKICSCLK